MGKSVSAYYQTDNALENGLTPLMQPAPAGPKIKLVSLLLVVVMLLAWFVVTDEYQTWNLTDEARGSRATTLNMIIEASNQGHHLQLSPGRPMEEHWEDPGFAFHTVLLGIIKRLLGQGPLNPRLAPYKVQLIILFIVFTLLYSGWLFRLPSWFYLALPLFTLIVILPLKSPESIIIQGHRWTTPAFGILHQSVSSHWGKVLSALWTAAVTLQIALWFKVYLHDPSRGLLTLKRLLRLLAFGLVFGLIASVRKDTLGPVVIALFVLCAFFFLYCIFKKPPKIFQSKARIGASALAVMAMVLVGAFTYLNIITVAWVIRDNVYSIKHTKGVYGHPTWHVMLISLGYAPNDLGLLWRDETGFEFVKKEPGNEKVAYGSAEHEIAAQRLFFKTIYHHPELVWLNLKAKAMKIFSDWWLFMILVLGGLGAVFLLARSDPWLSGLLLANWLSCLSIPLLIHPMQLFVIDFLCSGVWAGCVALVLAFLAIKRTDGAGDWLWNKLGRASMKSLL